jgi:hypothetical protein
LNGKHTIFGQVTDGYDVVETIAKTSVGAQDKPIEDVVIERIDIAEQRDRGPLLRRLEHLGYEALDAGAPGPLGTDGPASCSASSATTST